MEFLRSITMRRRNCGPSWLKSFFLTAVFIWLSLVPCQAQDTEPALIGRWFSLDYGLVLEFTGNQVVFPGSKVEYGVEHNAIYIKLENGAEEKLYEYELQDSGTLILFISEK
jgi:hypothetical protein